MHGEKVLTSAESNLLSISSPPVRHSSKPVGELLQICYVARKSAPAAHHICARPWSSLDLPPYSSSCAGVYPSRIACAYGLSSGMPATISLETCTTGSEEYALDGR